MYSGCTFHAINVQEGKQMEINVVAEKLFETLNDFDRYEVMDADYSVEKAKEDILNDPLFVINCLCDIISELNQ